MRKNEHKNTRHAAANNMTGIRLHKMKHMKALLLYHRSFKIARG